MTSDLPAPLSRFDMTGRAAIVTGAASGIGAKSAEYFAAMGASVMLVDRDRDALAETAAGFARSGQVVTRGADVGSRDDVFAAFRDAADRFGRLDVVANVAGIPCDATLGELDEALLDRVLSVNVKGTVFCCQAAAEAMVPQRSGSIVNVSSAAIDFPTKGNAGYAMSKAAVAMLTRTLAMELGENGIRVNTIAPGPTLTNFTKRHLRDESGREDPERLAEAVAQLRALSPIDAYGEVDDQALLVLYLGSDASKFVTGATLRANGGIGMVW